jgi:DNA-binding winged helix-turn-helix (wHTH) protein
MTVFMACQPSHRAGASNERVIICGLVPYDRVQVTDATDIHFDGWVLRVSSGELLRDGNTQRLAQQPLRILAELLQRPGEVVTRERLVQVLWPKGVVDFDNSLNAAVRKLRIALNDDSETPRYIETLPRIGYRFIGSITAGPAAPAPRPSRSWGSVGVGELDLTGLRSRLVAGTAAP